MEFSEQSRDKLRNLVAFEIDTITNLDLQLKFILSAIDISIFGGDSTPEINSDDLEAVERVYIQFVAKCYHTKTEISNSNLDDDTKNNLLTSIENILELSTEIKINYDQTLKLYERSMQFPE